VRKAGAPSSDLFVAARLPYITAGWSAFVEGSYKKPEAKGAPAELEAEYAVAIAEQMPWRGVARECLDELLGCPRGRGAFGYVEVQHAPAVMGEDD